LVIGALRSAKRHEGASRLVERGVPFKQVGDLLEHASVISTERYDNQKVENLQNAAAKLNAGRLFTIETARSAALQRRA
jgi:hypothetical protein